MKKVEVYFLINLGAILSLFAIEGELAIYMSRQDDILKNVAQDKLQTLVDINNIESVDVQNIRKNNLPTFTWTINNDEKLKLSQKFADNCIFENLLI